MAASETTDATFQADVLDSDVPVIVDFWAPWCAPCRAVAPILDQIAEEQGGAVKIIKLNVDDNPDTAMAQQITSIPALKLFVGGQNVGTMVGAHPKPVIEDAFAAVLKR